MSHFFRAGNYFGGFSWKIVGGDMWALESNEPWLLTFGRFDLNRNKELKNLSLCRHMGFAGETISQFTIITISATVKCKGSFNLFRSDASWL